MPKVFLPESSELEAYLQGVASKGFKDVKWPLYDLTVSHAAECAAHGVPDPEAENPYIRQLLDDLRPNEQEEVKRHRLNNFSQVTLAPWERTVNSLKRIYNPKLRHVAFPEWPRANIPDLEGYLNNLPFNIGSLEFFMVETGLDEALRDANSVIAVIPKASSLGDPSLFIEPVPFLFKSWQVIDKKDGEFYLLLTHRKSNIGTESKPKMEGAVLYLIDSQYVHLIVEIPGKNSSERRFTSFVFYEHGIGSPPVVHMPGKTEAKMGVPYKMSFMSGAFPDWRDALVDGSDMKAIKVRHAFPRYWELKIKCGDCRGTGQIDTKINGERSVGHCNVCNGTGIFNYSQSPTRMMVLDPKKLDDWTGPPMGYVSSDMSPLEFYRTEINNSIEKGLMALNMEGSASDSRAGESAEAKRVDQDGKHTFFESVAKGMYRMWAEIAFYISHERYGPIKGIEPKAITPVIKPPMRFGLLSAKELSDKVKAMKDSGISPPVVNEAEKELIRKEYGDDVQTANRLIAAIDLDPLPGINGDELMVMQEYTRDIDLRVHANIDRYIKEAIEKDETFLNKSRDEQRKIIYEIANLEITPADVPLVPGAPLDEENDIEAEARARLKGTVGGVQGILQIQQSVASGITQYEAGVAILKSIYGFSDEEARLLLGEPVDLRQTTETVPEE